MSSESVLNPPLFSTGSSVNQSTLNIIDKKQRDEDQVDPKFDMEEQKLILKKSLTRGFVLSLMVSGLYIYQKVMKRNQRGHNMNTFLLLFLTLSVCNYLMHTFTPEFYRYVISGIGWGVGSVMIKHIIDI